MRIFLASVSGAMAGSLVLVPFGVGYFGVARSGFFSDFLVMLYSFPVMLFLLIVFGVVLYFIKRLTGGVIGKELAVFLGALAGVVVAVYFGINNIALGGGIFALSGAVASWVFSYLVFERNGGIDLQ